MSTQSEALRLADLLEMGSIWQDQERAALELRRLHAELERCKQVCAATSEGWRADAEKWKERHDELLEALKQIEPILARMYGPQAAEVPPMQIVRAAIAKAEENT